MERGKWILRAGNVSEFAAGVDGRVRAPRGVLFLPYVCFVSCQNNRWRARWRNKKSRLGWRGGPAPVGSSGYS